MNTQKESCGVELIRVFKFNSAHFIVSHYFREPLHGHNYKVSVKITADHFNSMSHTCPDFSLLENPMMEICNGLKHCLLLPKLNPYMTISESLGTTTVKCEDGSVFDFPSSDLRVIEVEQVTAECLARYICERLENKIKNTVTLPLKKIRVQVFEDKGKCGAYILKMNTSD